MRKPVFAYAKTKSQISCTVTARLISAFVFAACIVFNIPLLSKSEISSLLTILCGSTARFVSDLIGNPEDRVSHDAAHFGIRQEKIYQEYIGTDKIEGIELVRAGLHVM